MGSIKFVDGVFTKIFYIINFLNNYIIIIISIAFETTIFDIFTISIIPFLFIDHAPIFIENKNSIYAAFYKKILILKILICGIYSAARISHLITKSNHHEIINFLYYHNKYWLHILHVIFALFTLLIAFLFLFELLLKRKAKKLFIKIKNQVHQIQQQQQHQQQQQQEQQNQERHNFSNYYKKGYINRIDHNNKDYNDYPIIITTTTSTNNQKKNHHNNLSHY